MPTSEILSAAVRLFARRGWRTAKVSKGKQGERERKREMPVAGSAKDGAYKRF